MAAGQAANVSAKVLALSQGVLKTMMITKVKLVTAAVLALGLSAAGASWSAYHVLAADQDSGALTNGQGGAAPAVSGEMTPNLAPMKLERTVAHTLIEHL